MSPMSLLAGAKAVVFDFDGTLVDSHEVWKSVDKHMFDWLKVEPPPGYLKTIEGKRMPEIVGYIMDYFNITHITAEDVLRHWEETLIDMYSYKVEFIDGAEAFLSLLASKGISIGIATSTTHKLVEAFFAKHSRVRELIRSVVTSEDVMHTKPAPDVFIKCFEALGVHPSEGVIFEDAIVGLSAASKTGSKVICVLSQPDSYEEKRALSNYQIKSYLRLLY